MSGRWIHERKSDYYHLKAVDEGYRTRASYKLKQIHEKYGVFDGARRVLDLGAAPGGWLQVASEHVDDEGLVLGVDLREIEPLPTPNVETIVGDVRDPEVQEEILRRFDGKADVILSDMAPDVTGQWDVDQYRQIELARIALRLSDRLLRDDGWLVVKIFQGGEHVKFIGEVRAMFELVRNFKPKASRKVSAERYVLARGLRPDRVLPREKTREEWFEEKDEGPIPGDQLPEPEDEG